MRTTLTLEQDILARLRRRMQETGMSFKAAVNETLRVGLDVARRQEELPRFKVEAFDMGVRPGIDLDDVSRLLEEVETRHTGEAD